MIRLLASLAATALALGTSIEPAFAHYTVQSPAPEIGYVDIGSDITLRRMIVHSVHPKGVVLLLQGFPETLYAGKMCLPTSQQTSKSMRSTGPDSDCRRGPPRTASLMARATMLASCGSTSPEPASIEPSSPSMRPISADFARCSLLTLDTAPLSEQR